jgi:hypothetical protein
MHTARNRDHRANCRYCAARLSRLNIAWQKDFHVLTRRFVKREAKLWAHPNRTRIYLTACQVFAAALAAVAVSSGNCRCQVGGDAGLIAGYQWTTSSQIALK